MTNNNQLKHVPAGSGAAFWGPGDQMRFLITGEETGGAFFMAEVSVPPGGGPPPHVHTREDESFYLQQGTLTIQIGDKTLTASPGDFVHLPRGIVHSFRNIGLEGRCSQVRHGVASAGALRTLGGRPAALLALWAAPPACGRRQTEYSFWWNARHEHQGTFQARPKRVGGWTRVDNGFDNAA